MNALSHPKEFTRDFLELQGVSGRFSYNICLRLGAVVHVSDLRPQEVEAGRSL